MLEITNIFTNCTISNRCGAKIEWIVWHYFGDLCTARECAAWFGNPLNEQGSADFCVDDDDIIQVSPDLETYYTWHCGGGLQGSIGHSKLGICRNSNSIGIELRPYNDRGAVSDAEQAGWYFHDATVKNAIVLTRYLMETYDIDAEHVIMHADVTGKYCPAPFLDRPQEWEAVKWHLKEDREAVKQILKDESPASFIVKVEIEDLRIRKLPGLDGEIVQYIEPGAYTIVDTKEKDGYTWGELKSGAGWIALDYTQWKN